MSVKKKKTRKSRKGIPIARRQYNSLGSERVLSNPNSTAVDVEVELLRYLIAVAIKGIRQERGITQADLCNKSQVMQGACSRLERGDGFPFHILVRLVKALDLSLSEFFEIVESKKYLLPPKKSLRELLEDKLDGLQKKA